MPLHHIASKRADDAKLGIGHIFARVGEGALFKSFSLALNGRVMRNEGVIEIVGDDAVAHIAAAVLGDGNEGAFHHDDTVFITHAAERCESRQVYKKVLKNGAEGIFQGKIPGQARRAKDRWLSDQPGALLDEGSQFLAKPELEIGADDEMLAWFDHRRAGRDGAALPALARGAERAGDRVLGPVLPRMRWTRSRTSGCATTS